MLALCIGTLTGLLSLTDLRNFDRPIVLLLAFVLGTVIVALIGGLVHSAVSSLAQYLEEGSRAADDGPSPRLRSLAVVIVLLSSALLFMVAEIVAEALGLRDLHLQRLISERRVGGGGGSAEGGLMPLALYMIVGTLISGPYIFYKAAKAWKESERTQRLSWLQHRRLQRLGSASRDADVQAALGHARRAERLAKA